jgi:hypothetical protein
MDGGASVSDSWRVVEAMTYESFRMPAFSPSFIPSCSGRPNKLIFAISLDKRCIDYDLYVFYMLSSAEQGLVQLS